MVPGVSFGKWKVGYSKNFLFKNRSVSAGLFRRDCWERTGGYDESMIFGAEDWDFWLKITGLGFEIRIIKEPLFFYRQTKNSMRLNNQLNYNQIFEKLFNNNYEIYKTHIKEIIIHQLNVNNKPEAGKEIRQENH